MPRMRTLKPEFWEDEAVAMLSRDARLLFMATWNAADDEGLLRWNAPYLKASAFVYDDDITVAYVEKMMAEIIEAGLIFPYIGGRTRQQLAVIVKFHKHQRPNRPQPSKLAAPSLQSPDVAQMYAERDDWTCHICFEPIPHGSESGKDQRRWLSLDHVKPKSKGGSDFPSNIRASHRMCNSGKKDSYTEPGPVLVSEPLRESFTESSSEPLTSGVVVGVGAGTGQGLGAGSVANAPRTTAQTIIAEWMERTPKRPPSNVIGHVSKHINVMLGEGIDPDDIRRGLATWMTKGLHPSTLPSVVNEVMNAAPPPPPGTGRATAKAQGWLALAQDIDPEGRLA